MSSLFRPEALAAKSNLWLGNVRLTQPIGYALTGLMGLSVAVVLGLFGAFGTYTKKATVIGQLAPTGGALRITQASSGNLIEARVKEGDTVRAGDVLFVVSSEREIEAHTLRAGMLAEADIVQDTRKLWEWALEPIFSVSGKLAASVRPERSEGFDPTHNARAEFVEAPRHHNPLSTTRKPT